INRTLKLGSLFGKLKKSSSGTFSKAESQLIKDTEAKTPTTPNLADIFTQPEIEPITDNTENQPTKVPEFKDYSANLPDLMEDEFDAVKMIEKSVENLSLSTNKQIVDPQIAQLNTTQQKIDNTPELDDDSDSDNDEPLTKAYQTHVKNTSQLGINSSVHQQNNNNAPAVNQPQNTFTQPINYNDTPIMVSDEASNALLYQNTEYVQNINQFYPDQYADNFNNNTDAHAHDAFNKNEFVNPDTFHQNNVFFNGNVPVPDNFAPMQNQQMNYPDFNGQFVNIQNPNIIPDQNFYNPQLVNNMGQRFPNNGISEIPLTQIDYHDGFAQNGQQQFQDNIFAPAFIEESGGPLLSIKANKVITENHKGLIGAIATREQIKINQKYRDSSSLIKGRQLRKTPDAANTFNANRGSKMFTADPVAENVNSWLNSGSNDDSPLPNTTTPQRLRNTNSVYFSDPMVKQPGMGIDNNINYTPTGRPKSLFFSNSVSNFKNINHGQPGNISSVRNSVFNSLSSYTNIYPNQDDDLPLSSNEALASAGLRNPNSSTVFKQSLNSSQYMNSSPLRQNSGTHQTHSNRNSAMFMTNNRNNVPRFNLNPANNVRYDDPMAQRNNFANNQQMQRMYNQNQVPDGDAYGYNMMENHNNYYSDGSKSKSNMTLNFASNPNIHQFQQKSQTRKSINGLNYQFDNTNDDSNTFTIEKNNNLRAIPKQQQPPAQNPKQKSLEFEYSINVPEAVAIKFEQFLDTCVESKPYSNTSSNDIYQAYVNFCSRNGIKPDDRVTYDDFVKMLISTDYTIKDNRNGGYTIYNAIVV
ncbi:hypothetical protein AYI70_g8300, partial [Smittium culicis]